MHRVDPLKHREKEMREFELMRKRKEKERALRESGATKQDVRLSSGSQPTRNEEPHKKPAKMTYKQLLKAGKSTKPDDMKLIKHDSATIAPSVLKKPPSSTIHPVLKRPYNDEIRNAARTIQPIIQQTISPKPKPKPRPFVSSLLKSMRQKHAAPKTKKTKQLPELIQVNKVKRDIPEIEEVQHEIRMRKNKGNMVDGQLNVPSVSSSPNRMQASQKRIQEKQLYSAKPTPKKPSNLSQPSAAIKGHNIRQPLGKNDKFMDDPDYIQNNTSSVIQQLMGRGRGNKRQIDYSDEYDSSDMEAGVDELRREEERTYKIAKMEDLREQRERERRKKMLGKI